MGIHEFIESGILEAYCLGGLGNEDHALVVRMATLHPEVKEELTRVELFIEQLAKLNAVEAVTPGLREKILSMIDQTSQGRLDLNDLPVIDERSDYQIWLNTVGHLIPAELTEDILFHSLRHDDRVIQTLVVSKINVPEESHHDLMESFLILQGYCECTIGSDILQAGPGDLIKIPLNVDHDVRVLSPVVVAVLQHQML